MRKHARTQASQQVSTLARPTCAQEELALAPCPLASLHSHRRTLGVIGLMHCPDVKDVARAYAQFEQRCK